MIDMAVQRFLETASSYAPSPHSLRQYRMVLKRFTDYIADKPSGDNPTPETILAYYRSLRDNGLSDATVLAHDRVLRLFFRRSVEYGWLETDIMAAMRRPRQPQRLKRAADWHTFDAMVAVCVRGIITSDKRVEYSRNLAILVWIADTGCRAGEVATLTLSDLDHDCRLAHITGKGRKQRLVPYATTTADAVSAWLDLRPAASSFVFPPLTNGSANALTPFGVSLILHRLAVEACVDKKPHRAHSWRHFAATNMVRNGVNLHDAARILGHSSITTTQEYLHLDADDLRRSHDASGPMRMIDNHPPHPVTSIQLPYRIPVYTDRPYMMTH